MNFKRAYRLGEYRIAEYEHGLLRWETHFNFGVQRSGKCYIFGNILILGNWSHEESGYLQLEFSELLNKLPVWEKTHYYCFASELLDVSTGQSLTNDFLDRYLMRTNSTDFKSVFTLSPGIFRLGRYQITVTDSSTVSWQTYEGLERVVSGPCIIESGLLFIGLQDYDQGVENKKQFLTKLNHLPKWDKTIAWCRSMVLRECQHTQQIANPVFEMYQQGMMNEHSFDEKPLTDEKLSSSYLNQCKESSERLLLSGFKWLGIAWHRIRGGKRWLKYLIPLFVVGLLLGMVLLWYSVEKKSHSPHWGKEQHHEHDD